MSLNREELKRMIDQIPEQDADVIGYLNIKREKAAQHHIDLESLSKDEDVIHQVQKSREDRTNGRVYNEEQGLEYLRRKAEEIERGQSL
jgi:hypothetical protein